MTTSAQDKAKPQRSDVFISYSRKDRDFVKRLEGELQGRGREAWVDWEGIRPTEEFMQAIYSAIESADTFVFVLTPDAVASEVCRREIAHAASHNKRMIPIVARDVSAKAVPETLAKLNWVFCRETDDFHTAIDTLISALDTDLDWVRVHTRLLTRAIEWDAKGKGNSFVLRGEDLRSAEQWLAQAGTEKERQPTVLQTEYVIGSRKAAARRQRITLGAVGFGAVLAAVLAILAMVSRNRAETERRNAEAATKRATLARDEAEKLIGFMIFELRGKLEPIGRLDLLDDVNRRVRAFYDSFSLEDESPKVLQQRGSLFLDEGKVAFDRGNLVAALQSYRDHLAFFERLARRDPGEITWQRDLAMSHAAIGDVEHAQGTPTAALESYRKSVAIFEKLAKQTLGNSTSLHDLSYGYDRIGKVQAAQGDVAGALESYHDSLAILERLSESDPGNASWQYDLSRCYERIGDVQSVQADLRRALESYRNSLAIRTKLVKKDANNAEWQRSLSVSYDNIGHVQSMKGDLVGALESHRDAFAIAEKLAKQDSSNADWQCDLATSHSNIGGVQHALNNLTDALQSLRASRDIFAKLVKQDPVNTNWQRYLSIVHGNIGDVQREQGNLDDALQSYRDSLSIAEKLAGRDPGNFEWQLDLAAHLRDIAKIFLMRSDIAGARPHCERYRDIADKLGERAPSNYIVQTERASARAYLAACADRHTAAGLASAVALVKEAINILLELQKRTPLQPMHATWLQDYQRRLTNAEKSTK